MAGEKKKKNTGCLVAIGIMMAIVVVILSFAVVAYNTILNQIPRVDPENEVTLSEDEIQAIERETDASEEIPEDVTMVEEEVTIPPKEVELINKPDHVINILLIGQDRRPGQGRQRSDTMILCTVDTQKKTLTMTSFLRDLYVHIPDWNGRTYLDNRLNACYAFGGMGMLDEALKQNFGIQVDHNIEVDFSGFQKIIDMIGGVDVYMTAAEAKYINSGTDRYHEGMNHLMSHDALRFARVRKIDSDFGRTDRQRRLLKSIFSSVKNLSPDQLKNLVNSILPMITTDMNNSEITSCMMQILPILPELEVTSQHIPAKGTYSSVYMRGMAVLVPDFEANIDILRQTIG